ncbi:MAG: flagellar filament capping protein FliD, partial [Dehalobacter sp.]|nr:flagellar filament capping protein FliD [Dehalobacter sp.]
RMPLDRLKQKKQTLEWQKDEYRTINNLMRTFRDTVSKMRFQSSYMAKSAVSSNESALTVSANANAVQGSYAVTVHQLAQGVSKGSQAALAEELNEDGTTKTLAEQFGLSGSVSFTLEGSGGSHDFTFDTATDNINSVVSAINEAGIGIKASYDSNLNRFFLSSTTTGSTAQIRVASDASGFLSDAGGTGANTLNLLLNNDGTVYAGQDAVFDFGDTLNLTSSTNKVTVNGITMNLRQGGGATSMVSITNDTDSSFNLISDFVSSYNDLIEEINSKLSETRYRDFLPLTDDEKEEMSEDEIKLWESKAKSGMLRNDSMISGILTKIRSELGSSVAGLTTFKTLSSIGITTGSYQEKGKLYINEAKLKEALQNDPDEVMDLFTKASDIDEEDGIAVRIYNEVNNGITQLSSKAGSSTSYSSYDNSTIGKQLSKIDSDIYKLEDRLNDIENRYWRQFTAMEKAIQSMNSQSAWLSQLSGLA